MAIVDFEPNAEGIYKGKDVFLSGPVAIAHPNPHIYRDLIIFMQSRGARVLTSFLAEVENEYKFSSEFNKSTGVNRWWIDKPEIEISRASRALVDQSTHFIALYDEESAGTLMLLQRALDKPEMRKNLTHVLLLAHTSVPEKRLSSNLIKGIRGYRSAYLERYDNTVQAEIKIHKFLTLH